MKQEQVPVTPEVASSSLVVPALLISRTYASCLSPFFVAELKTESIWGRFLR